MQAPDGNEPPLPCETVERAADNCNQHGNNELRRVHGMEILNDITAVVGIMPHAPLPPGLSSRIPEYIHADRRETRTQSQLVAEYMHAGTASDEDGGTASDEDGSDARALTAAAAAGWCALNVGSQIPSSCYGLSPGSFVWCDSSLSHASS